MANTVYVWDRFVRLFHWSLVALFTVSYLTGEEETIWHIYSGYAIATLVVARILWGFVGSRHARFRDFLYRPADVIQYGKALLGGKPKHYLGHNPLGGLMVVALLLTLLVATLSGMKLYAVEEGKGPFAQQTPLTLVNRAVADEDEHHKSGHREDDEEEDLWEEIHEVAVNLMLLLIVLHIAGVVVSSRVHGESLVKAMVTGYKSRHAQQVADHNE